MGTCSQLDLRTAITYKTRRIRCQINCTRFVIHISISCDFSRYCLLRITKTKKDRTNKLARIISLSLSHSSITQYFFTRRFLRSQLISQKKNVDFIYFIGFLFLEKI